MNACKNECKFMQFKKNKIMIVVFQLYERNFDINTPLILKFHQLESFKHTQKKNPVSSGIADRIYGYAKSFENISTIKCGSAKKNPTVFEEVLKLFSRHFNSNTSTRRTSYILLCTLNLLHKAQGYWVSNGAFE